MRGGSTASPLLMKTKRHTWYWLSAALLLSLAAAYALKADLYGRYQAHLQSEEQIHQFQSQVDHMRANVEAGHERVRALDSNPLENEAAVRRVKGWVRQDEQVYRVVEEPSGEQVSAP